MGGNDSMLRKFSKSALALILVTTIFASMASAKDTPEPEVYTPEQYTEYLIQLINDGDTGAIQTLEQFNSLPTTKQKAFLSFIFSEEYVNAMSEMLSGNETSSYKSSNQEIPIEIESSSTDQVQANQSSAGAFAARANQAASVSRSEKLSIFGVDTSTITLTVSWEHNGNAAVKPLQVIQGHLNRNPGFTLSETSNNSPGYISEGYFNATGTWTMRATASLGFVSDTLGINIKASTPSNKYYYTTSTKKNMNATNGWVKY